MENAPEGNSKTAQSAESKPYVRPLARPGKNGEITPEMRAIAYALTHPEGDPYTNGRNLGFYCENCG